MKHVFPLFLCALIVFTSPAATLEKWDFTGADGDILSSAPSTPGSVSLKDSGVFELQENTLSIQNAGKAESYLPTDVPSMGSGLTTGTYQLQWTVLSSDFANSFAAGTGGEFGFGFSDDGGATPQCLAMFGFNGTAFELSAVGIPDISATPVSSNGVSKIDYVTMRLVLDLDHRGLPGSAKIYYITGATEQMVSGTLPATFSIDSIYQRVYTRSGGTSWKAGDITYIDNLYLSSGDELIFSPELAFVHESVSFAPGGDHGILGGTTYEPGDVLQIVTTNMSASILPVTDVSTSLSADSTAFTITPLSATNFPTVAAGETYMATYQVEIRTGATNGPQTFTVVNQIGSGASAQAFPATFQ